MPQEAFPFKTYRTGQREAIEAARQAFERGKRFVIVEAPTGSGKSAIAATLAREASSAYLLTAQKILQDQYFRDFPDLALIKGRGNYPCEVNPHTTAAAAPCHLKHFMPACEECRYFAAKDVAMAANTASMNYAYYLAELNYSGGFGPRELLILDEAHNAEAALMGFVQVVVSEADLARYGLADERLPPFAGEDYQYLDFAESLLPKLQRLQAKTEREVKDNKNPFDRGAAEALRKKMWLEQLIGGIGLLLDSADEDAVEWVVERQRGAEGQSLSFKPVRVASFAEPLMFRNAERVLMLSATILDPPTYLRSLGIEPEDAEVVTVASAFAPENRPIYLRPVARLTRYYQERDLPKLVAQIGELLDTHAAEKGLIHTHSYKIAAAVAENLPRAQRERLVTHANAAERDAALERHRCSPHPTVLLTPSMTEGVDLADGLSRWQVICKIPYPYLGDPQVARRKSLDPAWYDWRTCLTVVQAYGRSVRSADDFADTYILDADFPAFLRRQRGRFPSWFLEAVQQ